MTFEGFEDKLPFLYYDGTLDVTHLSVNLYRVYGQQATSVNGALECCLKLRRMLSHTDSSRCVTKNDLNLSASYNFLQRNALMYDLSTYNSAHTSADCSYHSDFLIAPVITSMVSYVADQKLTTLTMVTFHLGASLHLSV